MLIVVVHGNKYDDNNSESSKAYKQNCKATPSLLTAFYLARAVVVPVSRRSGGRLATTLVATKNIFIFFFPVFLRRYLFS